MATMTVWKYDDAAGAERAKDTLAELQKEGLIQIVDAAIVEWDPSRKKPKTRQLHNLTAAGALSGSFWGLLFGLIFFVPPARDGRGRCDGCAERLSERCRDR